MRIVLPGYKILTPISEGGIDELKFIESIGRTCYMSNDKITEDGSSAKKFVSMLIERGHEAMIEFGDLTVQFYVNRGVTHELVRHRLASFAQESTRYCVYNLDKFGSRITMVLPVQYIDKLEFETQIGKDGLEEISYVNFAGDTICPDYIEWCKACANCEEKYLEMVNSSIRAEYARAVLPNSTKATITMKANYREWRNIFKLRADTVHAHPDMSYIMCKLLREVKSKIPIVFDDIYPEIV
jgi:thymidylate synthase (FAD)